MDRRTFIKAGCISCASVSMLSMLVQSCNTVKYTTGKLETNGISVFLSEFVTRKGERPYVIVQHPDLQYPICVYHLRDNSYNALLMRCTHQGAELQVSGDQLTCPAHGSAFNNSGMVMQSPATEDLRTFPTTIQGDQLFIDLRKKA